MLTKFTELHFETVTIAAVFLFVVLKPVCPFVVRQLVKFLCELQLINFVVRGKNHSFRLFFFHGYALL